MKRFTRFPVTDEAIYKSRRLLIKQAIACGLVAGGLVSPARGASEIAVTSEKRATTYCNYYEFSSNKQMIHHLAKAFSVSPWTLTIDGEVKKPIQVELSILPDDVSRTYPMRCVEGWTAVIPWQGVMLRDVLSMVEPNENAKYVKFHSVFRPDEMPMQRTGNFPWPYVEGLRLDEAMHPLTMLATKMYEKPLTKQNGAPIRLVVPWKYGYKSIKAITRIELTQNQPVGSWQQAVPSEYDFLANVNPNQPHPRWSQRRELLLGEKRKRKTLMYNGFESDVAALYA